MKKSLVFVLIITMVLMGVVFGNLSKFLPSKKANETQQDIRERMNVAEKAMNMSGQTMVDNSDQLFSLIVLGNMISGGIFTDSSYSIYKDDNYMLVISDYFEIGLECKLIPNHGDVVVITSKDYLSLLSGIQFCGIDLTHDLFMELSPNNSIITNDGIMIEMTKDEDNNELLAIASNLITL